MLNMRNTEFSGKIIWVVGATGALGTEISRRLAESGATVVASSRSRDKLEALQSALEPYSKIDIAPLDVTHDKEVKSVASEIISRHTHIDALINSTSVSLFADFLDLDDETWHGVIESKLMAYVRTCRAVIPHMVKRGAGNIINISGRSARQPLPTHLPGGCVNAAVNLLTKGLADRYYNDNVRVNAVSPGPIESDRFTAMKSSHDQNKSTTDARPILARKIGHPSDIAETVLWLLSERARHLTGTVIQVDGGSTACV